MPIPILKQGKVLIVSLQSAATDADLLLLRDELAARVGRDRSRSVVIDLTVLDVVDSFATRTLRGIAHTAKLRGAGMVVVRGAAGRGFRHGPARLDAGRHCHRARPGSRPAIVVGAGR